MVDNQFLDGDKIKFFVEQNASPEPAKKNLKSRILMGIVVFLALFIVSFTTVRALNTVRSANSAGEIVESKTFEVNTEPSMNLYDETVNVVTLNTTWSSLSYSAGFSDQAQREAAKKAAADAAAAARANAVALSQQSIASYTVAAASGAPENAPGSPAPLAPGNGYAPGYCTYYAYNRRYQLGRPIHNQWGNGGAWHISAARDGYGVDHTPEVGAVFEQSGHVAVVEAVGPDNTVFISEMNYGRLWQYNTRWVSGANGYWYIH